MNIYFSTVFVFSGKKGGALASSIFSYMQHGDPFVKSLIKHILTMVSQPNYAMLMRWIYDGELEDTHDEVYIGESFQDYSGIQDFEAGFP